MLFLFGGIPEIYYERFADRAMRELGGDRFAGLPLYPSSGQAYSLDHDYCDDLIKTLVAYIEGRPDALNQGLGVVLLLRPWEQNQFETDFWPFALCKTLYVNERISRDGIGAQRVANKYAATAISAATRLRKPVRALNAEYETRLRRTPLLLPMRHFSSQHLQDLVAETLEAVRNVGIPADAIKAACTRFESHHPYKKHGRGGCFKSGLGVEFKAPGRNSFHGRRALTKASGHNEACFLNARVRLGGSLPDGFHYDCTRGNFVYAGTFRNCHDAEAAYRGRPHLNVYPNDFIR